jgi:hypothetical protein
MLCGLAKNKFTEDSDVLCDKIGSFFAEKYFLKMQQTILDQYVDLMNH